MTVQQLFSEWLSLTISLVFPVKRWVKSSVLRSELEMDETGIGMPFPFASKEPPDICRFCARFFFRSDRDFTKTTDTCMLILPLVSASVE